MGSFDDKAEEHGVVMAQPVGVVPGGANTSVVTGGEARREEGDPSPHSGSFHFRDLLLPFPRKSQFLSKL